MINGIVPICVFVLMFVTANAQHEYSYYESDLSSNCGDCSTSEMNDYLIRKCREKDEQISNKYIFLLEKINTKSVEADSVYRLELARIKSDLLVVHTAWLELKKKAVSIYSDLGDNGTIKPIYYGLMYMVLSDQHLQYLLVFEETAFGDR